MNLDFKSIFESSPDHYLILLTDYPRFTIAGATDSYNHLTNTCKDIIGKAAFDVFPENPDESCSGGERSLRKSFMRVIEKKESDSLIILKYDIRKGTGFEERYWSVINSPVIENGEVKYILNRVEDVTEFVRMQKKDVHMEREILCRARQIQETNEMLQTAVELREDVLAIVSHDLSNPLGTIEMSADILKESLKGEETLERTEMIKVIERSVRHMKRLIQDLLNFAKIQSGSFTMEPERLSLRKLVLEAKQSVLHSALKKHIHIRVDIKTRLDDLVCDHDRILEVLSNILGNAIKFSDPGGLVNLKVSDRHGCLHFAIHDEGPGISEEDMPHLFDRYWQAKETSRQGAGLGLAIAKGIVLGHHGDIWAQSKVGHGTTMHFTIPLDFHLDTPSKVATNPADPEVRFRAAL